MRDRGGHRSSCGPAGGDRFRDRDLPIVTVASSDSDFFRPAPPPLPPRRRGAGGGRVSPTSPSSPSAGSSSWWSSGDAEAKRRRRVATYKAYGYEGKVKASLRKGFRWIKGRCSTLVRGW